jgi:hypothetical protein
MTRQDAASALVVFDEEGVRVRSGTLSDELPSTLEEMIVSDFGDTERPCPARSMVTTWKQSERRSVWNRQNFWLQRTSREGA